MTNRRRTAPRTLAPLSLAALLLVGCGEEPPPPPRPIGPGDVLLTIDGIDIAYDEVEPMRAKLVESFPGEGRQTVVQMILDDYLVPLKLAERAFSAERERALRQAEELCSVATNSEELDAVNVPAKERKRYGRTQLDPPISTFLFDPLLTGAVSPPIAVPRGYIVAAAHLILEQASTSMDLVEATRVGYFTHTVTEWQEWYDAERQRVADKVTYVHPDFRGALPPWCKRP